MEIIEIIVGVLAFALGWSIWSKVVDKADEIIEKKLSDKHYNYLICSLFVILFGAIIYSIIR